MESPFLKKAGGGNLERQSQWEKGERWKDSPSEKKCGRAEGTGDEVSLWLEATHYEGCRKAGSATRASPCPSGLGVGVAGSQ